MEKIDRRRFLQRTALLAGGAAVASPITQTLAMYSATAADGRPPRTTEGYGPLIPKKPVAAGPGADPDLEWLVLRTDSNT